MNTRFRILGVDCDISFTHEADCNYINAFMDAYEQDSTINPACANLDVYVTRRDELARKSGKRIPIHRTKHAYWTFDGILEDEDPRTVRWEGRGVRCIVSPDGAWLRTEVSSKIPPAYAGESAFHAIRGLALARRAHGPMLHASAVKLGAHAVAFCGGVGAGKSTLFTESVLRHNALPLSNDRILLKQVDDTCLCYSWPSYASYCEGTLLHYPELRKAAKLYDDGRVDYITQRWDNPLRDAFTKDSKRIYPMRWFSDAAGKSYSRVASLKALAFTTVNPNIRKFSSTPIDPSDPDCIQFLEDNLFPASDPSFCDWHGLSYTGEIYSPIDTATMLANTGVKVFRLNVPALDLSGFGDFLNRTCT